MKHTPSETVQITQAEWEVMRVLWEMKEPVTAAEVTQALEGTSSWKPKTVRTFLNRLVEKNAIQAKKKKIAGYELFHYSPLIGEQETIRHERQNFLSRFFGGTVQSMITHCIESGEISREELGRIREIIDEQFEKTPSPKSKARKNKEHSR